MEVESATTHMNSTTITKKNEEENYPAHYLSEAFFSNKSICIRNNHLQKAAVVGWGGRGWHGECTQPCWVKRRGLPFTSAGCRPCCVPYNRSTAERPPKQACANMSFVSIKMPLSLPGMGQKGQILPLSTAGALDHLTR